MNIYTGLSKMKKILLSADLSVLHQELGKCFSSDEISFEVVLSL